MRERNWLDVDAGCVRSNIRLARSVARDKKIIGVVKADCYGLGKELAKYCEDLLDSFAVASVSEATELRKTGINKDILVLGGQALDEKAVLRALKYDVTLSLSDIDGARLADSAAAGANGRLKVQIGVDSGMSRWGFALDGDEDIKRVFSMEHICVTGIFSHLAKADEQNDDMSARQIECFKEFCGKVANQTGFDGATHILNSAGIFRYPDSFGNSVRLGIAMYGYAPSAYFANCGLHPSAKWYARVVSVRRAREGTRVSYGGTYVCARPVTLATLAVGYADGYPRGLSGRGKVCINKKLYPIVGRICMDQCVVCVGDDDVSVGDVAEIMGDNVTAEQIASECATINYEILSRIGKRAERIYYDTCQ